MRDLPALGDGGGWFCRSLEPIPDDIPLIGMTCGLFKRELFMFLCGEVDLLIGLEGAFEVDLPPHQPRIKL
jgi:hypothetical protein